MKIDYPAIIKETLFVDQIIEQPKPTIIIGGKIVGVLNSFISICGLPKSRKTTFMNYFIASALTGLDFMSIKVNCDPFDKIIVFDTEQSIYDFSRQVKHLKYLIKAEKVPVNLEAYLFRQYDPEVILNSIYLIMQEKKPKIIFIDNITELVLNFNDPVESKKLVQ